MRTRPDTHLYSPVLRCPSFVNPFHVQSSLLIVSLCNLQLLVVSTVEKTRFCAFEKNMGYCPTDRPMDGRTDGLMDRRTNTRTNKPSYRDARTHLKLDSLKSH